MILLLSVSRSTSNKVADTDVVPLSRERETDKNGSEGAKTVDRGDTMLRESAVD